VDPFLKRAKPFANYTLPFGHDAPLTTNSDESGLVVTMARNEQANLASTVRCEVGEKGNGDRVQVWTELNEGQEILSDLSEETALVSNRFVCRYYFGGVSECDISDRVAQNLFTFEGSEDLSKIMHTEFSEPDFLYVQPTQINHLRLDLLAE
jgi:hypothetical protein